MFKVYFLNSNGEKDFLCEAVDFYTANLAITHFLKKHNYISHYTRFWKEAPNILKIDVGSHSEFFEIEGAVDEILAALR